MEDNNANNLRQIDLIYKEATEVENQFIDKKMLNMGCINLIERNGLKFLQQFAEINRDNESLNDQINSVRTVISMLNNEMSKAEMEKQQMDVIAVKE